MVGEIRDRETADTAFQAAMTGHLVFTTVHTNDTISTLSRLVDMGVERFKIGPGLLAVTAQRLARRLCDLCKVAVPTPDLDPITIAFMRSHGFQNGYFKNVGCESCDWSGYKGRLGLIEFLEINQSLRDQITSGMDEGALREAALKSGSLMTLTQDALWHLGNGDTTLDEVSPYIDLDKQTFRLSHEAVAANHPVQIVRPVSGKNSVRTILIAMENAAERSALRVAAEAEGFEVMESEDGDDAVALIDKERLALIVADLGLPGKNGFAIARHLRGGTKFEAFPILLTSSKNDEEIEIDAIQAGADDFVGKPASIKLVMARIKGLMRRSSYKNVV
jgi:CheY-like chemotaxis protein